MTDTHGTSKWKLPPDMVAETLATTFTREQLLDLFYVSGRRNISMHEFDEENKFKSYAKWLGEQSNEELAALIIDANTAKTVVPTQTFEQQIERDFSHVVHEIQNAERALADRKREIINAFSERATDYYMSFGYDKRSISCEINKQINAYYAGKK
ncbi:hypothetical protein [Rhodobacter capsulatus]|uniref:hypothetical protein n=1 Tax=Rhodobacter capsulatus TaxID=1061 RepID=UPI004024C35C